MIRRLGPLLSLFAMNACAQCVMCFRTAEAQQQARARLLNAGILILGVPPFLILGGFCWLAWKRSQTFADPPSDPIPEQLSNTEQH